MDAVTLRAHFDGQTIRLDEPFDLEPNTELIVMVLPKRSLTSEQADWTRLAQQNLASAYADDEADYSLDDIQEPNSEYEGG
jgi:hypothetical protein